MDAAYIAVQETEAVQSSKTQKRPKPFVCKDLNLEQVLGDHRRPQFGCKCGEVAQHQPGLWGEQWGGYTCGHRQKKCLDPFSFPELMEMAVQGKAWSTYLM